MKAKKKPTPRGPKIGNITITGKVQRVISDTRVVRWVDDQRGHTYEAFLEDNDECKPKPMIRAGCREWYSFKQAFAHYADKGHWLNNPDNAYEDRDERALQRQRIEHALRRMQVITKRFGWKL